MQATVTPTPALPSQQVDAATIARWLRHFVAPGCVTELRALGVSTPGYRRPHTVAGFFDHDHLGDMARIALSLSGQAHGVYFLPNPLHPAILARRANRVAEAGERELAHDTHVVERRWLLIDCDPIRPCRLTGISSSDEEKALALEVARDVCRGLKKRGWKNPAVCDSGNGYHLLYPLVGCAVSETEAVKAILHGIADEYDRPGEVEIDRGVFNAARIVKLYGTKACKGDDLPERPWRISRVMVEPQ